ncbi:MAG: hypothetical protein ACLFWD_09535 [Anaerolineales bacterium]
MDIERQAVKLLITYDPIPEKREAYFHFVLGEFVPAMEHLGLTMCEAWHTAYGEYPLRLAVFTADDDVVMEEVLDSSDFRRLEDRLMDYVANYYRRVVPGRQSFQF